MGKAISHGMYFQLLFEYMFFQNFDMGLGIVSMKKNYRGRKVLELPETCRSAKVFFAHGRKNLEKFH
jgi:hypothetical protein